MINNKCKFCNFTLTQCIDNDDDNITFLECFNDEYCHIAYYLKFNALEIFETEYIGFEHPGFSIYNEFLFHKHCRIRAKEKDIILENCYVDSIEKIKTYLLFI